MMQWARTTIIWISLIFTLLALFIAPRSFWRSDEVAWCRSVTVLNPPATRWSGRVRQVERRTVAGSFRGGIFVLFVRREHQVNPPQTPQGTWYYGGPLNETFFDSSARGARVAHSALFEVGQDGHGFDPVPRWRWLGFFGCWLNGRFSDGDEHWCLREIVFPDWFLILLAGWIPARFLRQGLVLRYRRRHGLCSDCGYDLRASKERCPECGRRLQPTGAQSPAPAWWAILPGAVLLAVAVAGFSVWCFWRQPVTLDWSAAVRHAARSPRIPGSAVVLHPGMSLRSFVDLPMRVELPLPDNAWMRLSLIPAGEFVMGSEADPGEISAECNHSDERPRHEVKLTRAFYMGQTTVTQEQFRAVMGHDPETGPDPRGGPFGADVSVAMSWSEAQRFCGKLGELAERQLHLPTEAQWEYACRAGTTTPFNTGRYLDRYAAKYSLGHRFPSNRIGMDLDVPYGPAPVASFSPNAWGLYDMHGNAMQWCEDWYGPYRSQRQVDPSGPEAGNERVIRGADWDSAPEHCRSASRWHGAPDARPCVVGVRVVMEID